MISSDVSEEEDLGVVTPSPAGLTPGLRGVATAPSRTSALRPNPRSGTCPGCLAPCGNLSTHLRSTGCGSTLTDGQLRTCGFHRCRFCHAMFKGSKGMAIHLHVCPANTERAQGPGGASPPKPRPRPPLSSSPPTPIARPVDATTSVSHPHMFPIPKPLNNNTPSPPPTISLSDTSPPNTAIPHTSSPAALRQSLPPPAFLPPTGPTLPRPQSVSANPLLTWVNRLDLESLVQNVCPRAVPYQLQAMFASAVDRTAMLCTQVSKKDCTAADRDLGMRLMLCLPKVASAKWAGKQCRSLSKKILRAFPFLPKDLAEEAIVGMTKVRAPKPPQMDEEAKLKAIARLIREKQLGKAAAVWDSEGVAPLTPENIGKLRDLHPPSQRPEHHPVVPTAPARIPHTANFVQDSPAKVTAGLGATMSKLPTHSAPGISGWTYTMIKMAWEASLNFRAWFVALALLVSVDDKAIPLRRWMTACCLLPLRKKKGGIRPIAIGETFARIIARWLLSATNTRQILLAEQFGVGTPGGTEPVVWSMNDAVHRIPEGAVVVGLDFVNAFNSMSRHWIASRIAAEAPHLLGYFRCFYNEPSALFAWDGTTMVELESAEGGRQGDPLFPLFFSMGVKGLIEELITRFGREDIIVDDEGIAMTKRLTWGYLDDLYVVLREGLTILDVMEFLCVPATIAKYGIRPNELGKCWAAYAKEMVAVGREVLGSWVGGPSDGTSPACALTMEVADRLASRRAILESPKLFLQDRLALLRMCYFPTLNHLLRTLPAGVGIEGVVQFDRTIFDIALGFIRSESISAESRNILNLPGRLGGLGLFNQEELKPLAAGASYILSRGYLASVSTALSPSSDDTMRVVVQQCADNMNLPVADLLAPTFWKDEKHIQRRAAEMWRESAWEDVLKALGQPSGPVHNFEMWVTSREGLLARSSQVRFLEGSTVLARAWTNVIASDRSRRLDDVEVRYALRRMCLDTFPECQPLAPAFKCARSTCAMDDDPTHHLLCKSNGHLATVRHTEIKKSLTSRVRQANCGDVRPEFHTGVFASNGKEIISDWTATVNEERNHYDVTVTADIPYWNNHMAWPSRQEVLSAVADDTAMGPRGLPMYFWDDHSNEVSHPTAVFLRKFRQMAMARSIGAALRRAEDTKDHKYAPAGGVVPIAITVGGGLGYKGREFIDRLCVQFEGKDLGVQSAFRKDLLGRISIILIRSAHRMALRNTQLGVY